MTPKAIVLAASKGGVGKSTIAAALAARAAKESAKVALVDIEAQGSLAMWWRLRGSPDNPQLYDGLGDPVADVAAAKRAGWHWIIVDSPPTMMDAIERAIEAGDFVLIPVRASVFDLAAIRAVVDLCNAHEKPFAFVMNAVDGRWHRLVQSSVSALAKMGTVLPEQIGYRMAYASALNQGKSGPEHPDRRQAREAETEVDALWSAVKRLAGKARVHEQ